MPAFHMVFDEPDPVHLKLKRKEIDFPLGAGSWIVEVDIEMEWIREADSQKPPSKPVPDLTPGEPAPRSVAAATALVDHDLKEAIEAHEATKD